MKLFYWAILVKLIFCTQVFAKKADQNYLEYLRLKSETISVNITNAKTLNFIPKLVLWDEKAGALVVPRPNPLKKVYDPEHPKSDKWGMIYLPNIEVPREKARLAKVKRQIKFYNN